MFDTQIVLILDNIRSLYNVGAIFRTADGLGVSKIYLVGITPVPPRKEIHKTALGAETRVPFEYSDSLATLIPQVKTQGFTVAALEITPSAISLSEYEPTFPLALIVGHEREGVGQSGLNQADIHLQIPMVGNNNDQLRRTIRADKAITSVSEQLKNNVSLVSNEHEKLLHTPRTEPMRGGIKSYNVATATAIALWQLKRPKSE